MNNTSVEKIGCFNTILDPYNGITIEQSSLPNSKEEFEINLDYLIENTQDRRNVIWIYIDIKRSDFIPIATKKGFFFHSCDEKYVLVVKRLIKGAIIPTAANHTLGVGAVVINEANQLLVIKERVSNLGFKLPGGHIDNGEMISSAVVREVKEETGIDVEFDSIISLGHFYPHQFHKSNLYILCIANAKSSEINIEDTKEILEARWMDINEYLEDEKVLSYSKAVVISALEYKGFKLANHETLCHIKKDFELFFPMTNK
ncbi:NUDIX hydrolase [Poseidonibacter ostreae]|jgi:8-oxo-dGTP diphosphatase|uniref:NUDIX domain-containing protein n=1 Tax=Poseidonibacter ostreae TaxID=2654171 RepID=A0A6L4WS75_9BACT|nr:NUDIX domain-containing protein [Poseidonibacter ostreae]KAB7887560.1 NUDIX domain-containing protein [Poseidonibacter ostreae]KAB7888381.1 NUDIX domain-containing protein [Poseidonibacter ostreae]MAC84508.1 DNA mismatch repair protein MutT [Arcobacter sp.]|tara:strand:- start:87 stop:863 length:777 start_codon:yes stop_codon:yes gene_type:complete